MDFIQGLFTAKDAPKVIPIDSKIRAVAFLPDGCIVSGEESSVQLRHLENFMGEPIESSTSVLAIATSRDGRYIVTGTTDGFTIWNRVHGGENPVAVTCHEINGVRTIDISSDSKWVVTGSDARTVDVWEMSTGERRPNLGPLKHEYNVIAVKFCPCGERIATATLYGSVRIYATSSGQKILTIPVSVTSTLSTPNLTLAWFVHRSQIFAVSQGQIKCLNSDDGSLIYQWAIRGVNHPSSVVLSPNSKLIAYCVNDIIILRDTATREQTGGNLKHDGNVSCFAFSSRGDLLVAGGDTKFSIWDLRKLLTDASYFSDTLEPPKSCVRHNEDATRKLPSTTFSLPLMSISNAAVKPWLHGFLDNAEQVLSTEIGDSNFVPNYNVFANRALIRGRLGNGDSAFEDAEMSLRIQPSAIGQVAKVIALIHQREFRLASQEIPKLLYTGHSDQHTFLLEVIQSILSCLSGEYNRETSKVTKLGGDKKLLLLVQANMHLSEKHFESAMESFHKAKMPAIFPHDESKEMWTISFVFGWKFSGLAIQIQQRKCEFLLDAGNSEAAVLFVEVKNTYQREIAMHVELSDWSTKFRRDCLTKLEGLGNQALDAGDWSEAIKHYTAVEPLIGDLELKHELLLKRSKAHAEIPENWRKALQDAEEAIKLNPSSPWGYDRKHAVLYAHRYYREAAEALDQMIVELMYSKDAKSIAMREQGVNPGETRKIIIGVVEETLAQPRPHILINTESGRLCDKQKQTEAFRAHPHYKDLVLAPASQVNPDGDWTEIIWRYFCYSTLSHTWEDDGELEFRDVENRPVDSLDPESIPNTKLQTFCKTARKHGYWWAWSDTCCINKAEREVLDVSLRSMYRWYSGSSLTIVHLKGVRHPLEVDINTLLHIFDHALDELLSDFVECRWNKRAWTLQEYFASGVIHFYTEDWKPYLLIDESSSEINPTNHKESRAIQRGMQLVTGLDATRLAALKPGSADARQKLRLASTRQATRREDIAYSLLGIFKVTIEAIYGDDEVPRALGRLLGALLTQSADVSILAWTGKPSEYNTCLPAEITVYKELESVHIPSPIEEATLAGLVSDMRSSMTQASFDAAIKLHDRLVDAPPPELHHGRLKLPCILFQIPFVTQNPMSRRYTATVEMLGKIEIRTTEDLSSARNMFLVHPWFRCFTDPGISLSDSARRDSALKLLARLRQPFGALLLALTSRDYERIATDQPIKVQIREEVSAEQLLENIRVLYIR